MTAKPHPHADLLHAIADGMQMEIRDTRTDCWVTETSERALRVIAEGLGDFVRIKPAKRKARRWWIRIDEGGNIYAMSDIEAAEFSAQWIEVIEALPDEQ